MRYATAAAVCAATMGVALGGVALGAASSASAAFPATVSGQQAVQAALDDSSAAWNVGDLDRFMTVYLPGAGTSYVSGSHFVRGYDAIRAMYAARFGGGSHDAMGQLSIEILDFRPLDPHLAYVTGRFHVHRSPAAGGDATGLTTLLFVRTPQGWRIVADHS